MERERWRVMERDGERWTEGESEMEIDGDRS